MNVMWKAAAVVALILGLTLIETGCGETYRPVATVAPTTTGEPAGGETEAVLHCCLSPTSVNAANTNIPTSMITDIDVSGDTNTGDKVTASVAASVTGPASGTTGNPMAMDGTRTVIFTANTAADTVAQTTISSSTSGYQTYTTTISLPLGSRPIGMAFQFYGPSYTLDYVVNSGTSSAVCPGTGSLGVINQSSTVLQTTVCLGTAASPANPVAAWIFRDQSKVFALDYQGAANGNVYVVAASKYKVTNKFAVGVGPVKFAASTDGNYVYTLNNGDGTISVIDAVNEVAVNSIDAASHGVCSTVAAPSTETSCSSPIIDIAMDLNYQDTSKSTQYNKIWVLHANGTLSVYDNTTPGTLVYVTSMSTLTPAQRAAGAYPTNLAMLRDGSRAFVGVGNTDKIVSVDTSRVSSVKGTITGGINTASGVATAVTVGTHRSVSNTMVDQAGVTFKVNEVTTPVVNYVAVSRQGLSSNNSPLLAKAYASTVTSTVYSYYDSTGAATTSRPSSDGTPSWCSDSGNTTTCANLYNGTSVVLGAAYQSTPANTYITTLPSPQVVTYCTYTSSDADGQKNCPLQVPSFILGRN